MAKNAWLVVSDLHLYYKNISSHVDYVEEMRGIRTKILEIGAKYRNQGYKANLLLLGDVFHRSYKDTFNTGYDNNFFVMWKEKFGDIYSVIGNHELSYYSSNPFFTLVREIKSERLSKITNRLWVPRGLLPTIEVVDRLDDGEVHFYFNHYGTGIQIPDSDGVNVGLFHQEIVSREVVKLMEAKTGDNIWADTVDFSSVDVFDKYKYVFLGHMHRIFGMFQSDAGTIIYYLASLGRTNVGEVNDAMLERDLPVLRVVDGKFEGIDSNRFNLLSYEESIKTGVAQNNAESYQLTKMKKVARQEETSDNDPIDELRNFFVDSEYVQIMIDGLLKYDVDRIGSSLRADFDKLGG